MELGLPVIERRQQRAAGLRVIPTAVTDAGEDIAGRGQRGWVERRAR